jgi:16S rRNA (cytosine1402-N4)-methyltransferase
MIGETIDALNIKKDGVYVDVTYGGGGHSRAILDRLGKNGRLFAFDQDEDAIKNKINDERLTLIRHNYRYLKNFLRYYDGLPVDGILADLGISSHQINEAERGFSLRFNASLDMRMNRESSLTAAEVVNTYSEKSLVDIFSKYGEVFNAKTLARKIIDARREKKINDINEFRSAINECVDKQHENQYYAKVFQALRIEVNDELESLKSMLAQSAQVFRFEKQAGCHLLSFARRQAVKNLIAKENSKASWRRIFSETSKVCHSIR